VAVTLVTATLFLLDPVPQRGLVVTAQPVYATKVHPRSTGSLQAGRASGRCSLAVLQGRALGTRHPSSRVPCHTSPQLMGPPARPATGGPSVPHRGAARARPQLPRKSGKCIGSLSRCDSNARTECKRFRDHNVQTVRLRVWRWSTHLEIFSSVLRGKKPGKGRGFPGTIAHSRFSTKRSIPPLLSVKCCHVSTVARYSKGGLWYECQPGAPVVHGCITALQYNKKQDAPVATREERPVPFVV
jgi:hypothetical protein